jgi:membrane protease YdiL (CAAX protease family)
MMDENRKNASSFPWKFLCLTFLLTWACWISAGTAYLERFGILTRILHYAGGVMPAVVAIYLLYHYNDPTERKDYWKRLIDLSRINRVWYGVIFLTVPILTVVGIIFDVILGGKGAELETVTSIINNPLTLIPFAVFTLLFGPLPEEMGWRGYALDGLQSRWNALEASLILGVAWTVWHLPLFFISGSYQQGLGIGTPQFWLYMLDKIPQSILMTWIYNNCQRSTASAIIFHFMINFMGELFDLSLQGEIIYIVSWWVMAVIVVSLWKPQRLARFSVSSQ